MLHEALTAAEALGTTTSAQVVNMPWLNRVDVDWLASSPSPSRSSSSSRITRRPGRSATAAPPYLDGRPADGVRRRRLARLRDPTRSAPLSRARRLLRSPTASHSRFAPAPRREAGLARPSGPVFVRLFFDTGIVGDLRHRLGDRSSSSCSTRVNTRLPGANALATRRTRGRSVSRARVGMRAKVPVTRTVARPQGRLLPTLAPSQPP